MCLSVQSILQDRETVTRLGIPVNVCERLQERTQGINLELLNKSIKCFKGKISIRHSLAWYCENPLSIVYSHFLFLLLPTMFFVLLLNNFYDNLLFTTNEYDYFRIIAITVATIIFFILHIRTLLLGTLFFLIIVIVSPLLLCSLPIVLLVWLLCCRQRHCTHCCKVDFVP